MPDPIQQSLIELGKLRGQIYTELLRLPSPGPMKYALQDVESILSKADSEIQAVVRKLQANPTEALREMRKILPGLPEV